MEEPRRRPGGRSAKVRAAVIDSTIELLAENGMGAVTVAEVAARAGVHETSIYRRWETRERLVLDALVSRSEELLTVPNTGSVRRDLIQFGKQVVKYATTPLGQALLRTLATCDDGGVSTRQSFWRSRHDEAQTMVNRAKERGELDDAIGSQELLELFIAPIHFRLLLTREAVTGKDLARWADAAISAAH